MPPQVKKPVDRTGPKLVKAEIPERLRRLLGKPVPLPSRATEHMDGRLVPLVFATVTGPDGAPRAGVKVELLDAKREVVDVTRTSAAGLAVLRFPPRAPRRRAPSTTHGHGDTQGLPAVAGALRIADGTEDGFQHPVEVRAGQHHAITDVRVDRLDESVVPPFGGAEQLPRLPTDFSPETCEALSGGRVEGLLGENGLPTRPDPLIPGAPAGQGAIAGERTALIRRLNAVKTLPDGSKWLVQLRVEWMLLGYTLGELASVTPLDPGSVVQEADQVLDSVTTAVRDTASTLTSTLTDTLSDVLSTYGSVDSVVNATASVSGGVVGGFIGIPLIGGFGGAGGWLDTSSTVSTSVDTSLLVNRTLHQVSTLVNQALAHAEAIAQGVQRSTANVVNHLAPLVSRVTNALHWRVYENYAVCTHVEGVLRIDSFPISEGDTFRFDEYWARALRAFLEPALLDRTLAANFAHLATAAETPGLGSATLEIHYDAFSLSPARAEVNLGGATTTISLPPGQNRVVRRTVTFPTPVLPGTRVTGTVTFVPGDPVFVLPATVDVTRLSVWVDSPLTTAPDQVSDNPGGTVAIDVRTEGGAPLLSGDALVQHLNANRAYYLDVLAAAAMRFPALRVDAARDNGPLATLPADLYDLPIVGFEGNEVLVAVPVDDDDKPADAVLLERDPGSGTLVQLLAPGAYGEVFQGLSVLSDLTNALHPALKAVAPSQFVEFPEQPVLPPSPLDGATNGSNGSNGSGAGDLVGSLGL